MNHRNQIDMTRAFGRAPERFKNSVGEVLFELRREETRRLPRRRILIAAVAVMTLLITGVVYALVTQYRLADFYQQYYEVSLPPEIQEEMAQEAPEGAVRVGPLLFRVQEAYLENDTLYLSAGISSADGSAAYFTATDVGPEDNVSSFFRENPGQDPRSYLEAARQDGRKLYHVNFSANVLQGENIGGMAEYAILPDGTAAYVYIGQLDAVPAGLEKVQVEYLMVVNEVDLNTGEYLEDTYRQTFQSEVSLRRSPESAGIAVNRVFAGSAIRLDEIVFQASSLGTDCLMYCTNLEDAPGIQFSFDSDYWLALVDAQGEYLDLGPGGGGIEQLEDGRWLVTQSMRNEQVPSSGGALYIKLYDVMGDKKAIDMMEVRIP